MRSLPSEKADFILRKIKLVKVMQKVTVRTEGRKPGEIWEKYKCGKTLSIAEERRPKLQKERGKAVF